MKVKTLGVLAALGMLGTSASVWSLTARPRGAAPAVADAVPSATLPASTASPSFQDSGPLSFEGRVGHARVRADGPGETYVLATVGAAADGASAAAPMNLAIVVDRSGSMKGKRMQNALAAARAMIRRLRDGDVLSVVSYSGSTETVLPSTRIDESSRERAVRSLDGIVARGETCISCGIDAAMAALRAQTGMTTRILLLSDGEATSGVKDIPGFRRIAENARHMGCAISSVGIDTEYNERVLSALALESNGKHYFAENASEVQVAFDKELASLVRTVAGDVKVSLELGPGVEVSQVFDRSFEQQGQKLTVSMGSFAAGEQKTLLVKLRLPKGPEGELGVATLGLSGVEPSARAPLSASGRLSVVRTLSVIDEGLDPAVAARLGRSASADSIEEANRLFNSGDLAAARARLKQELADVGKNKAEAAKKRPLSPGLASDFDRQAAELEKADRRLSDAPAQAKPGQKPEDSVAGKSGTKRNVEAANPFRL